jgi:exopolyphosphatase/guanosine-5'-triphosphate,3'-diphosphate pyrophosphatase
MILDMPDVIENEKDRILVALLARYHRKAAPSSKHEHFAGLSHTAQTAVRSLSAILRIADALDASWLGAVHGFEAALSDKKLQQASPGTVFQRRPII